MPVLMGLLGNKYTWIAGAFIALLSFYQVKTWNLQSNIKTLKTEKADLIRDLNTTKGNLNTCVAANVTNKIAMDKMIGKVKILEDLNGEIVGEKDKEIARLKGIIADIQRVDVYPDEVHYENITIKIKDTPDENDTTFNILNHIGD